MPRTKCKEVFSFDELSEAAKEKARDWYREGALDYDWWEYIYEDAATIAGFLGIDLRQKPVRLMGGGTRYDPSIYFQLSYSQGDGAAFEGHWQASKVNLKKLKEHAPQDEELARIGTVLADIAERHKDANAACSLTHRDNQKVSAELNTDRSDEEHSLKEWEIINTEERAVEEEIEEALEDFATWIYGQLRAECDYRMSDEAVDEEIKVNGYEFNEDGTRA